MLSTGPQPLVHKLELEGIISCQIKLSFVGMRLRNRQANKETFKRTTLFQTISGVSERYQSASRYTSYVSVAYCVSFACIKILVTFVFHTIMPKKKWYTSIDNTPSFAPHPKLVTSSCHFRSSSLTPKSKEHISTTDTN